MYMCKHGRAHVHIPMYISDGSIGKVTIAQLPPPNGCWEFSALMIGCPSEQSQGQGLELFGKLCAPLLAGGLRWHPGPAALSRRLSLGTFQPQLGTSVSLEKCED